MSLDKEFYKKNNDLLAQLDSLITETRLQTGRPLTNAQVDDLIDHPNQLHEHIVFFLNEEGDWKDDTHHSECDIDLQNILESWANIKIKQEKDTRFQCIGENCSRKWCPIGELGPADMCKSCWKQDDPPPNHTRIPTDSWPSVDDIPYIPGAPFYKQGFFSLKGVNS